MLAEPRSRTIVRTARGWLPASEVVLTLAEWLGALAIAWLPAAVGGQFGLTPALASAVVSVLALVWLGRRVPATPLLVVTLLASSALTPSGLVPAGYQYAPIAVAGAALLVDFAWLLVERRQTVVTPPRSLLVILGAYVGWAAVSTLFSIDLALSAIYTVGIAVTLSIAFLVVPSLADARPLGRAVAQAIAVLGVLAALASIVLLVIGPTSLFDREMGRYLITELTLVGARTGIVVPWAMGAFLSPASQAEVLAVALVALLWLRESGAARPRASYAAAIVLVLLALLVALSRTGWLAALAGTGVLVGIGLLRRRIDAWALVTSIVLAAALGLTLTDTVGAVLRPDLEVARYGAPVQVDPDSTTGGSAVNPGGPSPGPDGESPGEPLPEVRGGATMSGRLAIWLASIDAIVERPLVGHGPGTNPAALESALSGGLGGYRGLSSHSTWLRTGVEFGLPGLAILAAFVLTTLGFIAAALRPRATATSGPLDRTRALPALGAMFVVLLAAQTFETSLLGGWNFPSLAWALCAGVAVAGAASARRAAGTADAAG